MKLLADYLRDQAVWRDGMYEAYPEDHRNARCACALRALATYVEQLPSDDEDIRVLDALQEPYDSDVLMLGEEAQRMISRFGFHREVEEEKFPVFLHQIVEVEASESVDFDFEHDEGFRQGEDYFS